MDFRVVLGEEKIVTPRWFFGTSLPTFGLPVAPPRYSIRTALLGLVGIPLFALFAALAFDTYRQDEENIARANRTAIRIAESTATKTELSLARAEHILSVLAQRPQVQALDPARCDSLLADLKRLTPVYANVLTLNAHGRLVCSATGITPGQATGPDPKYYFAETVRMRRFTVGKPAKGFITGRWVSTLAYPILNTDGRVTGVVAVSIDLANYHPFVANQNLPPTAVVGIINGESTIIARSEDAEKRVGGISDSELTRIAAVQREGTIRASDYKGADRFVAFTPIPRSDWIALVTIDAASVLAPARRAALERLLFALAILAVITTLTYLLTRRIARPIEAILKSIAAVRDGRLDSRAPAGGPNEIHQIAVELNAMLDASAQAQAATRESEARLSMALEATQIGIWDWDIKRDLWHASPTYFTMLGYEPEAGPSDRAVWLDRVHPDDREIVAGAISNVLRGSSAPYRYEARMRHADGSYRWVAVQGKVVERCADGSPIHLRGARIDIDERKQAERTRRESEEKLRLFIQYAPSAIAMFDHDMRYIAYSRRWLVDYGLGEQALAGRSHYEVFPEIPERWKEIHRRCLAGATETCDEDPFPRADGRVDWVRWEVHPWRTSEGKIGGVIVFSELITSRKLAEQELRESEERFRAMIEQSISGTCIVDREGRFAYVNPRMTGILGYASSDALVGRRVLELVAPESRDLVRENMRERLAGEPQRARYNFEAIRMDGSRITLGAHGNAGTYRGEPVLITTVQDVTELSRAEEEIARTVDKLKRAVQSTIGVVSIIGELRDPYTHGHERRVGEIATSLATELGLSADLVEGIRIAGYLHDVGKIAIPAEILSKPTRLSKVEFDLVKGHAQQSYEILKTVEFPWPVAEAAWQHHERMDGTGYPRGLKGDQIILEARILAVADTVEAMASHRPYRPGLGIEAALAEIERGRATLYDPAVADACLRMFRDNGYAIPE